MSREPLDHEWFDDDDESTETEDPRLHAFPWTPIQIVAALITLHLGLVLLAIGPLAWGPRLFRGGGLSTELTADEPWRLVTSLFLHADLPHALWNGLAMMVFAVPLLLRLGALRTGLIYLTAGIGGGLTALHFADSGTVIIGSSGAVAGLFGAWIVVTLRSAGNRLLSWRGRVRTLGVAFLFLPSLLNPTTSSGQSVSVSSHLGGLATGMLVGAVLSFTMKLRRRDDAPDEAAPIEPRRA
jgi:membrane associated rhomboid family serine protease